ncbi:MAG: NAD(P) transhydrogenase subunit alpha [Lachnospiraceae bacterium]|nr:NAD(P) transhydrogenase subunit alpha [Lachnospiraceae bacterium]
MSPWILVLLFIVSAVVGYFIIRNIPALLHTPLMSGMNALSGITILGAIIDATMAQTTLGRIAAVLACFLAAVNVAGGFALTHKMLLMFSGKKHDKAEEGTDHE